MSGWKWCVLVSALGLAIGVAATAYLNQRSKDPRRPGLPMTERLKIVRSQLNPDLYSVPKDAIIEERRAVISQQASFEPRMEAWLRFAYMLITDGRTQEAIDELLAARDAIAKSGEPAAARLDAIVGEALMMAYLRLGEQENCLRNHTADSCIFPISGDGVHIDPNGSRLAIEQMKEVLARDPRSVQCIWLLNLAHMTLGEYPAGVPREFLIPPRVFKSDGDLPRFMDIAPRVGLDVTGLAGGVVMDDFDNDGDLDLIMSAWGLHEPMRSFVNNGDGTFTDNTESAGLTGQTGGLNLVHADYDNDGWLDFLVLRGAWQRKDGEHPNSLLRNMGDGTFTDVTEQAGILSFHPTQTAAWGDYDNDGRLDLFIGNESTEGVHAPCELYRNNGDGTFTDVAADVGLDVVKFVKGAAWGDYDNEGRIDLFLSCVQQPNLLFRNVGMTDGHWRFEDVSIRAGVMAPFASFPAWFFDYDNDGRLDLLVASFSDYWKENLRFVVADYLGVEQDVDRAALYRNNGDGTFTDVAPQMEFDKFLLAMGANYGDLDNDGWLDCYFGTGEPNLMTLVPNRMFRNDQGRVFQDVTTAGGFGHVQKGHGIAFGDLDQDGDQDIYAVMGGSYSGDFYQNVLFENPGNDNHWITLRLEGVKANRCAIGARIRIELDTPAGQRSVHLLAGSGGSFGANSLQQEAGLGDAVAIRAITIEWPGSGTIDRIENITMDGVVHIREGEGIAHPVETRPFELRGDGGSHGHHHH